MKTEYEFLRIDRIIKIIERNIKEGTITRNQGERLIQDIEHEQNNNQWKTP